MSIDNKPYQRFILYLATCDIARLCSLSVILAHFFKDVFWYSLDCSSEIKVTHSLMRSLKLVVERLRAFMSIDYRSYHEGWVYTHVNRR